MTTTEYSWAKDLLTRMGYPVNQNNMTSIMAWEYAEGGHFHNTAHYNPLNTTMDSSRYGVMAGGNTSGVATYPDYETGMAKTIETLKLGHYDKVRHDLSTSAAPATTVAAITASPWGTWHGVPSGPALDRARDEVKDHKGLAKGGSDEGKDHGKDHGKGHGTDHGKGHGKGHGSSGAAGSNGSNKVVLDLHELDRLSRVYRTATDEITRHRRVVGDIAAALEPARAALPDKALAAYIKSTFDFLLAPGGGFDNDARLHDMLSAYTADVHRLAQEADADHNGKWSSAEAKAFAGKHTGDDDAALRAVTEALAGGSIVKRTPPTAKPDAGGKGGGDGKDGNGKGGDTSPGKGNDRLARVDKMLDYARTQHASEHNGDNRTKYGAWYQQNGVPWCAQFVSYVMAKSGNHLPAIDGSHGFASVSNGISYAREHGQLNSTPRPGDIFLLKDGSHTGIVDKVNSDGTFTTIEGNHGDKVAHDVRNSKSGQFYFWTAIRP